MTETTSAQSVEITDVLSEPQLLEDARHDLWVFGYGSLMWRPDFDYRLCLPVSVYGWHRQFTLLSIKAWGTKERPGLSAALHPGGSVLGLAFSVPPHARDITLEGLYRREAAYLPKEVACQSVAGQAIEALTFVTKPGSDRFLHAPSLAKQAMHIAQGDGPRGTSLFYLEQTVEMLDRLGSGRTSAHLLLDFVRGSDSKKPD